MHRVKTLCSKLSKYYWSTLHPSEYTLPSGRGLGMVAHTSYGAFNLIWAGYPLVTIEDHARAIEAFMHQSLLNTQVIHGAELDTWLTLLSKDEFGCWYESTKHLIRPNDRLNIERAVYGMERLQKFQP